ncbi:nodulation receptor kinase-like isoform X2 [Telopea speciosissima]|uniref:nodulation receptor kinase-like isoform X2 n=1 Tax=Telopea speciosissima TaxID=54955 RepID=UPI001CC72359|nr:nodulation receptor kinase-like isoform X2 [Telopea speciosissima]
MMEPVNSATLIGICLLSFFLLLLIQPACAQNGFVSLWCCAPSNGTDPSTNITWNSDLNLFNNIGKCQEISSPVINNASYTWARIFNPGPGNKWCYNLTTVMDQDYLIRGTFPRGLSLGSSIDTFFNISFGATSIGQVKSTDNSSVVEGFIRATNHYIDFCLLGVKGSPYISDLELRPLGNLLYPELDLSNVLKLVSRVDVGNTKGVIRYPYDTSDRIWATSSSLSNSSIIISNTSISVNGANASVPIQVLQTALTDKTQLQFIQDNLDLSNKNYLIFLYFLELDGSIKKGERMFDIYVNGEKRYGNFDVLGGGTISNYRKAVFNASTENGILNVTLVGVQQRLGPICNAYEILQVHTRSEGTVQQDANVIMEVRDELIANNPENEVLLSWSGDPCLPFPWQGLGCDPINSSAAITSVDLSSRALQGSLPSHITELANLKALNLSFNDFTGTILSFPDSSMLTSMDVRDNELIGSITNSFSSLPYLTKLYFGCNLQFSNALPSGLLNRANLTTDFGICVVGGSSLAVHQIIIYAVTGLCLLFAVAAGIIFMCNKKRLMARGRLEQGRTLKTKNQIYSLPSPEIFSLTSVSIPTFTLECIETSTSNYKTLIGEGGFGSVYYGTLPDGQEVAVKVRSGTSTQGCGEFDNELKLLSAIRHENLVPLLGYCSESNQLILVYPFMSNGSLHDHLYAKQKTLAWPTRLSIALGTARGLVYLHTFSGRYVVHGDVKSSNILLDHNMCAKLADFGFSECAPQEGDNGSCLEVRGTAGYVDPECYSAQTHQFSANIDVFSFGVVLLEILTGREPLNIQEPHNVWSLVEWAKSFIMISRIEDIVDPAIKTGYNAETVWKVIEVALACTESHSAYRPYMTDVVRELEDALNMEKNASENLKSIDSN